MSAGPNLRCCQCLPPSSDLNSPPPQIDPSLSTLSALPNPDETCEFLQVRPPSILSETPCVAVPANKVCPLFASDRMLVTLGEPMRTNERPPLVLLRTPWRSLPTYTILLSSGSTSMALTLESALMGFQVVPALVDLKAPCPVEPA